MTMAALSVLSTAAQISAQNKAAQAQGRAANARTQAMYAQQQAQQEEVKAQAGAKLTEEALARQAERGKIQAAQGESGVAGVSSIRELANSYMQQSFDTGSIVSKEEAAIRSSAMQSQASYLEGVNAVNQANSQITSPISAMLQIGIAGAGAYASGSEIQGKAAEGSWIKSLY